MGYNLFLVYFKKYFYFIIFYCSKAIYYFGYFYHICRHNEILLILLVLKLVFLGKEFCLQIKTVFFSIILWCINVLSLVVLILLILPNQCKKAETLLGQQRSVKSRLWFFLWSCMDVRVGLWGKLSAEELMLLNCGVGEDSWESLGLQGGPTSPS